MKEMKEEIEKTYNLKIIDALCLTRGLSHVINAYWSDSASSAGNQNRAHRRSAYRLPRRVLQFFLAMTTLFLTLSAADYAHAQVKPKIRELDTNVLDIDENIKNTGDNPIYSTENLRNDSGRYTKGKDKDIINAPVLKGGISELHATVGKSQIVRFDEPVVQISITNPELIDIRPLSSTKEFLVSGKQGGETTVIIWGESGEPVFFNLFVDNENYKIVDEIRKLAPNENIDIDFIDSGGNTGLQVVLKGRFSSSILKEKIENVIKAYRHTMVDLTETLEPQVLLEVRIVELGRSKNKNRGYEFKKGLFDYLSLTETASQYNANLYLAGETLNQPWFKDIAWKLLEKGGLISTPENNFVQVEKTSLGGIGYDSNGNFGAWKAFPGSNLAYKLKAAESEGIVKTLSEPRVMVINKQQATFNSGSQIPIPTGTDELGNTQYEYTNIGTQITITPTILEESERILLDISAIVSEIDTSIEVNGGPGLNTRESKTKVEIANNATTVITGLVRKSESKTVSKLPMLSNLPVIGSMFNNITSANDDTELMIFVTASIVKPDLVKGE